MATLRQIVERLTTMRDRGLVRVEMARLEGTVTGALEALKTVAVQHADHETRLRRIERWMYAAPASAIIAAATALVAVLARHT